MKTNPSTLILLFGAILVILGAALLLSPRPVDWSIPQELPF